METETGARGFDEKGAAVYVGISAIYLRQSRMSKYAAEKEGPPFCRIGRKVIYLKDDLDRWLESRRVKQSEGA